MAAYPDSSEGNSQCNGDWQKWRPDPEVAYQGAQKGPCKAHLFDVCTVNVHSASEPASVPSPAALSTWSYVEGACTRWSVAQRRADAGEAEMKNNAT